MKTLFVSGRNLELAKAEALSFLERQGNPARGISAGQNAFLLETGSWLDAQKTIKALGSTIALGKELCSGTIEEIEEFIASREVYFGEKNNFTYSLMEFADEASASAVLGALRQKFKSEKTKARFKAMRGTILTQEGGVIAGTPSKASATDATFFLFKSGNALSFGFIEAFADTKEAEQFDMGKPVRRESLAIPPRLAKALVNLSQTRQGQTILDPFCGIGIILQEAMLQGINVAGVDINNTAVSDARRNIEWLRKKYRAQANAKIMQGDARDVPLQNIGGIATEPSLGTLLKRIPHKTEALQMQARFETLMIAVLNNLKTALSPGAKIAFTAPCINTGKARIGCDIQKICAATHLKMREFGFNVKQPLRDYRPTQTVGREIFVLEK